MVSLEGRESYYLTCPECGEEFDPEQLQTFCHGCNSPLLAHYDLPRFKRILSPDSFSARPRGLWRWAELLPVCHPLPRYSLGEGDTPLLKSQRLASAIGLSSLYIKDESTNATGTFKARGLAVAVARAVELGVHEFVIPTAGNAGGALAAYASRAGAVAHVFMPQDSPLVNRQEVGMFGADLHLVDGLINDAGREAAAEAQKHGWFDLSTFKEPYRVEGKKTMGFELAEAFGWSLPDVILYPTGGGTGLVGMWKAFNELEELGWIDSRRPRMVSVQAEGCAPVVKAFTSGSERMQPWLNASTIASGLRVPLPFADRLILRVLRESKGTAISVSEEEILSSQREMARLEGVFASYEGAATLAGLKHLLADHWITPDETIVLFNTGTGLKTIQ